MPKIKPKKTLLKRIKITKSGKILKKQNRTGHLKRKWSTNQRLRKVQLEEIQSSGYIKKVKNMIAKNSKGI